MRCISTESVFHGFSRFLEKKRQDKPTQTMYEINTNTQTLQFIFIHNENSLSFPQLYYNIYIFTTTTRTPPLHTSPLHISVIINWLCPIVLGNTNKYTHTNTPSSNCHHIPKNIHIIRRSHHKTITTNTNTMRSIFHC